MFIDIQDSNSNVSKTYHPNLSRISPCMCSAPLPLMPTKLRKGTFMFFYSYISKYCFPFCSISLVNVVQRCREVSSVQHHLIWENEIFTIFNSLVWMKHRCWCSHLVRRTISVLPFVLFMKWRICNQEIWENQLCLP